MKKENLIIFRESLQHSSYHSSPSSTSHAWCEGRNYIFHSADIKLRVFKFYVYECRMDKYGKLIF